MLKRLTALLLGVLIVPALAAAATPKPVPVDEALKPYAGKIVYVDFWASWCTPCAESFPWLNTLQTKFGPKLVVVGVNVDESDTASARFLKHHPAGFDVIRDAQGKIAEHYNIPGMPTSLILDEQGRVLHVHSGFLPERINEYEAAIRAALNHQGDSK
ncbi:TlpA family protein disulfide reductase [Sinimarinibacterium sp. CAU 1509]|uniref:TlpA family protein disulfide reductase n=1 Tax=Sinimarinibacterium sp. CAU 1509 TaxID=2562283 RepID=UPI001469CC23|nr:TlpA disulfide reductase family protein [Sinimarinibacterium sp. CAU 1509]